MARKSRRSIGVLANSCNINNTINNGNTINTINANNDTAANCNRIFQTAIYARLSFDDSNKKDSDTIENQVYFVMQFIDGQPDLHLCATFIDNGETGVNFDRPQFNKMMEAVKSGGINCIVVKDLSRFGRNYIEIGNYLEKIFPFMGVRFISVNDGYDNHDPASSYDGLAISLKSLINDVYAKDISRKVKSAMETKQKKGEFLGSNASYGYLRCEENDSKLVVNEETAPTVKDIFRWKLEGESYTTICRKLNSMGVASPGKYLYKKGLVQHRKYANSIWNPETVKGILKNPVYTGCTVMGKRRSRLTQGLPCVSVSPDEWIILPDKHEAIIDKETFEAVSKILDGIRATYHSKADKNAHLKIEDVENIFAGVLKCGNCGASLKRHRHIKSTKVLHSFYCPKYRVNQSNDVGCVKYVNEEKLAAIVWGRIKAEINLCVDKIRIIEKIRNNSTVESKANVIKGQITDIKKKIKRLDSLLSGLYNDYSENVLTESEYLFTKAKLREERRLLQAEVDGLLETDAKYKDTFIINNEWMSAIKDFSNEKNLSRTMLVELIDHITIAKDNLINIVFKHKDEYEALMCHAEGEVLHHVL